MKNLNQYIIEKLEGKYFDLIAVGDILPHRQILDAAYTGDGYDFSSIFRYMKPILKDYDVCFCNQEAIIGGGEVKGGHSDIARKNNKTTVVFNSPDSLGDCVIDTGFNVISLANNHMCDMGKDGLEYSRKYWSKKLVISSGQDDDTPESRVKLFKKNGIKVAFVAYTTFINLLNKSSIISHTNVYYYDKAQEDIQYAHDNADVVIVSIHWGTEYEEEMIDYKQKDIARQLAGLGVDLILGHHPHVVQQIEYIGKTLCVYSLGNCVACQLGDATCKRVGGMLSLRVCMNDNEHVTIKNIKPRLLYMYYTEDYHDFCIIPFNMLDDTKLIGYKEIQKEYENKFRIL